ncbi:3-hydroxyacyl-ACP dehydratase FabZ family protein [Lutimonas halocynthiae]|uniref:3-hydroxyacyl-ACP dehydratase FabZ family protein n=1 Tax=Lutimonas halocynthiae TaxID=1446477 RepID=UPI0025B5F525|nr:3-hydroxyacyl-ACP dehydratase FabZ family protein [Lutimonas halocynthiae]MDN3644390.1 3-hydroxyacyl-ACP dehydratase FabZ family protein [Lutimonas halocynthiae]
MTSEEIIKYLPYREPFLFVDEIIEVSEESITGVYTFSEESYFYKGHFKDQPVTPGVILTETMAQIGLVCLGIYLIRDELNKGLPKIALSSHKMDFYIPVFPGEKVTVVSEKKVFRFGKLKCFVQLFNEKNELICRGEIAGMLKAAYE